MTSRGYKWRLRQCQQGRGIVADVTDQQAGLKHLSSSANTSPAVTSSHNFTIELKPQIRNIQRRKKWHQTEQQRVE